MSICRLAKLRGRGGPRIPSIVVNVIPIEPRIALEVPLGTEASEYLSVGVDLSIGEIEGEGWSSLIIYSS